MRFLSRFDASKSVPRVRWTVQWLLNLLMLCLSAMPFAACTPALPRQPGQAAMSYEAKVNMRFHGFQRTYRVHLPPGYTSGQPLPLVVVLHGAFDTADGIERISGFSQLADQHNFIALYPNGIGILGYLQHWNAGHCCGKAAADKTDDVGFLTQVIEDAGARLAVDRGRIYMTGFSNGGMMVHRFAAERGDLLSAAAPLAASAGGRPDDQTPEWSIPEPVRPLPLLVMHGLADAYVPFDGGTSSARATVRQYWSVEKSLAIWRQRNQCQALPVTHDERQSTVHITAWQACSQGADIVLYTLKGWDHDWPGPYFTSKLDATHALRDFDIAPIIWDFFKAHSK
jgi:polyhydroxybutyrate depolymerase